MDKIKTNQCNKEISECCIVCLKQCKLSDITHISEKSLKLQINISDLLELCGGFKMSKSYGFPQGICSKCLKELHNAAAFRDKCQASIEFLMQQVIDTKEITAEENDDLDEVLHHISLEIENDSSQNVLNFNSSSNSNINQNIEQINYVQLDISNFNQNNNNNVNQQNNNIESNNHIVGIADKETVQLIQNDMFEANAAKKTVDLEEIFDNIDESLNEISKECIYKYSCDICGSAFKTILYLRKHFVKHTSTWFTCIACWHPFSNKSMLEKHFATHHKNADIAAHIEFADLKDEYKNAVVTTKQKCFDKVDQYLCNKCNKVFQNLDFLEKHLMTHTKKNFKCNKCEKLFSSSANLIQHLRVHESVRPFGCKYCDMKFKDQSNLSVHIRRHAAIKPHKCTLCEKSFTRTNLLKEHMLTHTGEKPFTCEICYKAFSKKRIYVNHKMTHSDTKFCCDFCPQKFVRESQLNFHVKNYHKELIIKTTLF